MISISSDNWVGRFACNTAVVAHVSGHLDVSSGSPSGSPWVLHQVVIATSFTSVSDSKDSVVETAGRAASAVVDSRSVTTEGACGSIDGNRHWSNTGKGVGQVALTSWAGVMVSTASCDNLSSVEFAASLAGSVAVRVLSLDTTSIFDVSPAGLVPTSLASVVTVTSRTVDKLLFSQAWESSWLLLPLTCSKGQKVL